MTAAGERSVASAMREQVDPVAEMLATGHVTTVAPGEPHYRFSAFGISFSSPMALPFRRSEGAGPTDVEIELVATEDPITLPGGMFNDWHATSGSWVGEIHDQARFVVTGGRHIHIALTPRHRAYVVLSFLTGSVIAALLQQRGVVPLHACSVATSKGAILVTGRSGAGKSTLATILARRGLPLMADDISAVSLDSEGRPVALPAFPASRLWRDTLDRLDLNGNVGYQVRPELEKFLVPVENFHGRAEPVRAIIALATHNGPEISGCRLDRRAAFAALGANTYRKRFYAENGEMAAHFWISSALASNIPMIRLIRPEAPFDPDGLADQVLHWIDDHDAVAGDDPAPGQRHRGLPGW